MTIAPPGSIGGLKDGIVRVTGASAPSNGIRPATTVVATTPTTAISIQLTAGHVNSLSSVEEGSSVSSFFVGPVATGGEPSLVLCATRRLGNRGTGRSMEPIGPASVSTITRTVSAGTTSATCNQHAVVNGVRIGTEIGPASTSSGVSGLTLAGSTAVVSRRIRISSFTTCSTAVELVEFARGDRNSGRDASSSTSAANSAAKGGCHSAGTNQSHGNLRDSSRNGKVLGISSEGEAHYNFCRKERRGTLSGSSGLDTWIGWAERGRTYCGPKSRFSRRIGRSGSGIGGRLFSWRKGRTGGSGRWLRGRGKCWKRCGGPGRLVGWSRRSCIIPMKDEQDGQSDHNKREFHDRNWLNM